MPRRQVEDDDDEEEEEEFDEEEEEEALGGRKRYAYDEDDDDYNQGRRKKNRKSSNPFIDEEAAVATDEEEPDDDEDVEEDFINHSGLLDNEEGHEKSNRLWVPHRAEDEEEDYEELERKVRKRYARVYEDYECGDGGVREVEQQALLPSVKDPKLWMVKCAIGRERETALCLMQKFIDRPELQIRSVIALDHLKNFLYVEADREAHVKEACKGMRNIFSSAAIKLVPIKEMTDILSVEKKTVDLTRDTWVRMKLGVYKGDLGRVVKIDDVRQKVTVKLIPRIDMQYLANKLEGRDVGKKRTFVPPPRFFNMEEAREFNIRVDHRKDRDSGIYYETIDNMMFKDGFLYKTLSMKSVSSKNIQPTLDELEKFQEPGDNGRTDMASLTTLCANRKKGHFMKGDAVVVIRGDLKNLMGWVEKVEEENVHIRPKVSGLPKTLAFNGKDLCKYFKLGDHVKVVKGVQEGATGMVVKVEGHVVTIISDTTREDIRIFADNVVDSSEVSSGTVRIGDYELHDLVLLDNMSFGVIIRVEPEALQVLKGVPGKSEVVTVKLREIRTKISGRTNAQDNCGNTVSMKDVVRVLVGPCKGKQGPVEHIHRGILFIHDRHHLEHSGFICVKAQSCIVVGGDRNGKYPLNPRFGALRSSSDTLQSPARPPKGPTVESVGRHRGGRGQDPLFGRSIKIRLGPFKGYRGRVKEVTGILVRVELESQMKIVTVKRNDISDVAALETSFYGTPRQGGETPMHTSQTPHRSYQTPVRDLGATPTRDGMRTPMHDQAWAPLSYPRGQWEDGNPDTWGSSPQSQPGTPTSRPYEASIPGSGWTNPPQRKNIEPGQCRESSPSYVSSSSPYLPSTPGAQLVPPSSASYLPGTPGGQLMTPGNIGLDAVSPIIEDEGNWLTPDIIVKVSKPGEDSCDGVIKEVMKDGSCKVVIGVTGGGDVTAIPAEVETARPKKSDRIKIMTGMFQGCTGKLIGIDGSDGIVKLDATYDVKILDMAILAKLAGG